MTTEHSSQPGNLTHAKADGSFDELVQLTKQRIIDRGNLPHATINEQLKIVDELCEFPLGRFILERKGANGFWTDYMISHPTQGKITGLNIEGKQFSALEDFFLNRCPIVVAHQERFAIFQKLAQKQIKENVIFASIPCGMMRDLITLDFSSIRNFQLVGIDIDLESIDFAKNLANEHNIKNIHFEQLDAWKLGYENHFDLITSSGLNVYESDPKRVLELYLNFFEALKPGGVLITSLITFPPGEKEISDWDLSHVPEIDLLTDQILHKDVLDIKWRNFRSSKNLKAEFEAAGFVNVQVFFDKRRIFPTIQAEKPI